MSAKLHHNTPTIFVIFGATGDLTRRKLIPSLFALFRGGFLPHTFRIVGFAHSEHNDAEFAHMMREVLVTHYGTSDALQAEITQFVEMISYQQGGFEDAEAYQMLAEKTIALEKTIGQCTNKLFYLAVPPMHYEVLLRNLAHSGMTIPCNDAVGWTRVLVEKPFGDDLETAQELDALLGNLFHEEQIFRIDHYLAKETIQNILTFRFANTIFEPVWSNKYIDRIEMVLAESLDVGTRGNFYEGIGALRDVGQNHMLQTIALLMMDHPGTLDAAAIRRERAAVLTRLQPMPHFLDHVVRGQYDGYRETPGVAPASETETFFHLRAMVDNARWRGVPITLTSGKALDAKETVVRVFFKKAPSFADTIEGYTMHTHRNIVTFRIQPQEGIDMTFFAKRPGLVGDMAPRAFGFDYRETENVTEPDAYEKVLFDCIRGDQTLFASTEEVLATWRFVTPILTQWKDVPLVSYAKGSSVDAIVE
jgi:glucose-6-phosphate 1-dehydrogenase